MPVRILSTYLLLLCAPFISKASEFRYTHNCLEAEKAISLLKLGVAKRYLDLERSANPNNVAVEYLENYIDYYRILSNQNEKDFRAVEKHKSERAEKIAQLDDGNPYKRYAQAELSVQWAFLHGLFEDYFSSGLEFRSAFLDLETNARKFPSFLGNMKNLATLKAILGTIPEGFKWLSAVAGMKGDFNEGMAMLRRYIDHPLFRYEPTLDQQGARYTLILFELNFVRDKKQAWKTCDSFTLDYPVSPGSAYLRAYTAIDCGQNDEAIYTLTHRPTGNDYEPFYTLDYLMGKAKCGKLETDGAIYFKKYVSFYHGKYLLRESYRYLSFIALLDNDTTHFSVYRNLALKNSSRVSEEEKIISNDISKGVYPNRDLIKARLLFDGGYFRKAEDVLKDKKAADFATDYQVLEFYYRLGRIYHESGNMAKAIDMYKNVIASQAFSATYYQPNSCLQMGYIYEKLGYKETARYYYKKVSDYKGFEYRNIMQQKAKAGLERLK